MEDLHLPVSLCRLLTILTSSKCAEAERRRAEADQSYHLVWFVRHARDEKSYIDNKR